MIDWSGPLTKGKAVVVYVAPDMPECIEAQMNNGAVQVIGWDLWGDGWWDPLPLGSRSLIPLSTRWGALV